MTPKKILVATDLTDDSNALQAASRVAAEAGGAEVILLHVVEDPAEGAYGEKSTEGRDRAAWALWKVTTAEIESRLRARMAEAAPNLGGCRAMCLFGDPAERIAETVKAEEVDLLVISGRRRSSLLQGTRLGQVAYKVVRTVPCDVLLVK